MTLPGQSEYVACHAEGPSGVQPCVREQGHDGPHRWWSGVDVEGGRKSAVWLVEPTDQGNGLKTVGHADFEGRHDENCAIFASALLDLAAARGAEA